MSYVTRRLEKYKSRYCDRRIKIASKAPRAGHIAELQLSKEII